MKKKNPQNIILASLQYGTLGIYAVFLQKKILPFTSYNFLLANDVIYNLERLGTGSCGKQYAGQCLTFFVGVNICVLEC